PSKEWTCRQRCDLRLSAAFGDDGGGRRRRVHREGADETGNDAASAHAGKISTNVVRLALLRGKSAGDRRGLHDADHGDDERERYQVSKLASPWHRLQLQPPKLHGKSVHPAT